MMKQEVTLNKIQLYIIYHKLILLDLFTNGDLYDADNYTSYADWKTEKKPESDLKKIKFNINKSETDLKKIEFNIYVNDYEIDDMNNNKAVHLNDGLADNKFKFLKSYL